MLMKNSLIMVMLCTSGMAFTQHYVHGNVTDEGTGKRLPGILVTVENSKTVSTTNQNGEFSIVVPASGTNLNISGALYETYRIKLQEPLPATLEIAMVPRATDIQEVVMSTGYQKIPKDRATGAFSSVDRSMLSRQVTTNIMDRLAAVANGVVIDRGVDGSPHLTVRGISTIQGPRNPLVVLDNFPYEGNLSHINPDMVENITFLKDAAASSIWGARAANGVIVITTKKPKGRQPLTAQLTVNTTFSNKPDLRYIRQMASSDFIAVERQLFQQGFYDSDIAAPHHPVLTPVVDILNQQREGLISDDDAQRQLSALGNVDVRDQYRQYMYLPGRQLQYALNISQGGPQFSWIAGFGYDSNTGNLGESYGRTNFRLFNNWKLTDKLTAATEVLYTDTRNRSGRTPYGGISMGANWRVPYIRFADDNGNPLVVNSIYNQRYKESVMSNGLLDWNYYPLTDWSHNISTQSDQEVILNATVQYQIIKGLNADIKYQYQRAYGLSKTLYDAQSYYARNYINTMANLDDGGVLHFNVPKGGILDQNNALSETSNVRAQANYNYSSANHTVSALAGAETRAAKTAYEHNRYYGYNAATGSSVSVDYNQPYPTFVTGDADFIQKGQFMNVKNTRFVSLYANAAYTYAKKYTLSGSVRRDASNLFGLSTNDQWNPFWSAGAAWQLSQERFYKLAWLPDLKLRATYGFNGNIDPSMVAVTTIVYDADPSVYTGTGIARIDQYYNPKLRWETSRMLNFAIDFSSSAGSVSGSIDFFTKKGTNLFGTAPLDYTTGVTTLLWNVAGMKGNGVDVELKTKNLTHTALKWNTVINYSHYRDQVTDYYRPNSFAGSYVSANGLSVPVSGVVGLPVYAIFAYKWAGLDPENGDPRGYLNGDLSKDYAAITGSEKGIGELQYFGSAIPTSYGSVINTLTFKNISLDIGITYKLGYWFRRSSVSYTDLIISRNGHSDFADRWQKPGDELLTDIPSFTGEADSSRDAFFNGSSVLVEKGDHVRLQFLNLNYTLNKDQLLQIPLSQLQLYCAISNLGIVWRANKKGLDPDYSWGSTSLKPVTSYSLGFRANF